MNSTVRICETVIGRTVAELVAARDAVRHADMVELRLDGLERVEVGALLAGRSRPVVVTCRPTWEGGRFSGDELTRVAYLDAALRTGAEFVDVEWRALSGAGGDALRRLLAAFPDRVLLSMHDFQSVPDDLPGLAREMWGTGARTIKVAVAVSRLSESLVLREIGQAGRAVVIAMGEAGVPTRLLPGRFGSEWTYAGDGVAPGQVPAARMVEEFRVPSVRPGTRLFGVVGRHAGQSFSPRLHNAAFGAGGHDAVYVPLRAADFPDFEQFAAALGIEGASVTIPYKRDALQASARVSAEASTVGAVNTLRRESEGWSAINTDVEGFLEPLRAAYPGHLRGIRAAVLGAGGAARAVLAGLRAAGVRSTVHARRRTAAEELASAFGAVAGDWPVPGGTWDLLVNTTPLGGPGHRDESPLAGGPLDGTLVYDLTYGPEPSALVRAAVAAGCQALDGLPMLVAQAERQFTWWMGVPPPAGVMAAAAQAHVRGSAERAGGK